ncbi:MAG: hypothetical protein HQ579_02800 [Candidatus Omnitrophica bacterium]|nr:hypothetical protein [Candidatus Omnitrophota bacterium]
MNKQGLSHCGGICNENSAVIKLYNPSKLNVNQVSGPILFKRIAYCINHGCGWRQNYPDIQMDVAAATNAKPRSIDSYLRRVQKRFPGIHVRMFWKIWIGLDVPNFESYLKELKRVIRQPKESVQSKTK